MKHAGFSFIKRWRKGQRAVKREKGEGRDDSIEYSRIVE